MHLWLFRPIDWHDQYVIFGKFADTTLAPPDALKALSSNLYGDGCWFIMVMVTSRWVGVEALRALWMLPVFGYFPSGLLWSALRKLVLSCRGLFIAIGIISNDTAIIFVIACHQPSHNIHQRSPPHTNRRRRLFPSSLMSPSERFNGEGIS